jgi:hypothetical protein
LTYISSAQRIAAFVFSERRATLRDTRPVLRAKVRGATNEKINAFFSVTTIP